MTGKHYEPTSAKQAEETLDRADCLLERARYYLSTLRLSADVRPEVWGTVQGALVNVEEALRLLDLDQR